jgi:hypothetical protein
MRLLSGVAIEPPTYFRFIRRRYHPLPTPKVQTYRNRVQHSQVHHRIQGPTIPLDRSDVKL